MEYFVSVIVPIYNVEKYLKKCLLSLFSQTLNPVEYIFINDCSSDGSLDILAEVADDFKHLSSKITIISNEQNKGVSACRNIGLNVSKGKYLYFIDSDDWIESDCLNDLFRTAESQNLDLLWTDYYLSLPNQEIYVSQNQPNNNQILIKGLITEKQHGAVWNKFFKRSLAVDHQLTFSEGLSMWEDLKFSVELFYYAQSIAYLPKAYYHYVQYNNQSLSAIKSKKKFEDIQVNTLSIISFLNEKNINDIDQEINILKLASKQNLLFDQEIKSFKDWNSIFPESNAYIWSFTSLPIHLRFIGWSTSKKLWAIIHFYIFIKRLKS